MADDKDAKRANFAHFVGEHQAALRSFLRVIGVSPGSVDDLAQETFLVAFKELDHFNKDENFGKWLRGIARNLTRNELRKNARRSRILDQGLTQHLLSETQEDSSGKDYEEIDYRALRDCLEDLPPKSRKLVAGRYADEWKSDFLADQFNMTATAVRLALMRIRKQLRVCVENKLPNA